MTPAHSERLGPIIGMQWGDEERETEHGIWMKSSLTVIWLSYVLSQPTN